MHALHNGTTFLFAAILGAAGGRAGFSLPSTPTAPTSISRSVHVVKMIGDQKGFRFTPARLTIESGDAVKFVLISGAPHNVAFDAESIPAEAKERLAANMADDTGSLTGDLKTSPGDTFTVSFRNVKPGKYPYYCVPHRAVGMTGVIIVR
jgi:plastocyanin